MSNPFKRDSVFFRATCILCIATFLASSFPAYALEPAQTPSLYAASLNVPLPDKLIALSPSYQPVALRGLRFYPEDPLRLDFILDKSDTQTAPDQLKTESSKLIRYFLSSLTIPEEDIWVNLSPYEQDKVIPAELGLTDMGKDLLREDYLLKQLTASLTYPDSPLGKEFWQAVYQKAHQLFGTAKIPFNTFNKIWIVPDRAVIYEDKDRAILGEAKLKVMLEEDYLAFKNRDQKPENANQKGKIKLTEADERNINNFSSSIMREIVLPAIEKEVNEGKNFAELRQIYHSLILAIWFKQKLKTQINANLTQINADNEPILNKIYIDKKKIKGVDTDDPKIKEKVYQLYVQAYKNGLYNYIKSDFDPFERKPIKRRYYSGGMDATNIGNIVTASPINQAPKLASSSSVNIELASAAADIPAVHKASPNDKLIASSAVQAKDISPEFGTPVLDNFIVGNKYLFWWKHLIDAYFEIWDKPHDDVTNIFKEDQLKKEFIHNLESKDTRVLEAAKNKLDKITKRIYSEWKKGFKEIEGCTVNFDLSPEILERLINDVFLNHTINSILTNPAEDPQIKDFASWFQKNKTLLKEQYHLIYRKGNVIVNESHIDLTSRNSLNNLRVTLAHEYMHAAFLELPPEDKKFLELKYEEMKKNPHLSSIIREAYGGGFYASQYNDSDFSFWTEIFAYAFYDMSIMELDERGKYNYITSLQVELPSKKGVYAYLDEVRLRQINSEILKKANRGVLHIRFKLGNNVDLRQFFNEEYKVYVIPDDMKDVLKNMQAEEKGKVLLLEGYIFITESTLEEIQKGDKELLRQIIYQKYIIDYDLFHPYIDFDREQNIVREIYAIISSFVETFGEDSYSVVAERKDKIISNIIKDYISDITEVRHKNNFIFRTAKAFNSLFRSYDIFDIEAIENLKTVTTLEQIRMMRPQTKIRSHLDKNGQPLCLTPDSLIYLADGTVKPLIELKPFTNLRGSQGGVEGDMVLSLNESTGRLEPHRVLALLDMGLKPVYRIITASGKSLKTTLTHPYLTREGWKKLSEIKAGEEVAVARGDVLGAQRIEGREMAFLRGVQQARAHIRADKDGVKSLKLKGSSQNNRVTTREVIFQDKFIGLDDIIRRYFGNANFFAQDVFAQSVNNDVQFCSSYPAAIFNPIEGRKEFSYRKAANDNLGFCLFKYFNEGIASDLLMVAFDQGRGIKEIKHSLLKFVSHPAYLFGHASLKSGQSLMDLSERDVSFGEPFLKDLLFTPFNGKTHLNEVIKSNFVLGDRHNSASFLKINISSYSSQDNLSIAFEPIARIEPLGNLPVYDIEVEGTHNFIAQGIVAHNTYTGAASLAVEKNDWAKIERFNQVHGMDIIERIQELFSRKEKIRILDLGSGESANLMQAIKRVFLESDRIEIYAIDKKRAEGEIPGVNFIQGDVNEKLRELSDKGEKFDAIVSTGALMYFDNPIEVLELTEKMLTEDGFASLHMLPEPAYDTKIKEMQEFIRSGRKMEYKKISFQTTGFEDEPIIQDAGIFYIDSQKNNRDGQKPSVNSAAEAKKGGIDLNPQNLELEISGAGGAAYSEKGAGVSSSPVVNVPFDLQNFQGFTFQIISIQPMKEGEAVFG